MLIAIHGDLLVALEQSLGAVGELAGQAAVTGLVHQEGAVALFLGLLGIHNELVGLSSGVEAEQVPVAALDGLLHLSLAVGHAALDAVHLAGSIADDEGGTMIGLSLLNGLEGLSGVSTHSHLSHIHIAVAHGDLRQALLLDFLTGSRELSDLADVGRLGGLSAGVGVHFSIEHEDVDVFAGSKNVIHAAEADVVGPAVAAEDPGI